MTKVLPLKEQYELMDLATKERVKTLLPALMRETGLDCWMILAKEYNEDPVLPFVTYTSFPTARRLTCLIFYDDGNQVHYYNAGRPDPSLNLLYEPVWRLAEETQFACINRILDTCNPSKIGLNYSSDFAFGDGLTKSLFDEFAANVPSWMPNVVSAQTLAVRYLETRIPQEQARYRVVCKVAEEIIRKAFSSAVITPGLTRTSDVEWFMKQATNDLGLPFWFPPTVDIQRPGYGMLDGDDIILEGDLLHCDYGLTYLGLCTDTQRLAYVACQDETKIPEDLKTAMRENNRFQDIVTGHMIAGRTGNEILLSSLEDAKKEGIRAILYSHPIGTHGHGAGPTIGLWNQQEPIPVKGDHPLHYDTNYALELTTIHAVPSFGVDVRMMSEETIQFTKQGVAYLMSGRDEIILIR